MNSNPYLADKLLKIVVAFSIFTIKTSEQTWKATFTPNPTKSCEKERESIRSERDSTIDSGFCPDSIHFSRILLKKPSFHFVCIQKTSDELERKFNLWKSKVHFLTKRKLFFQVISFYGSILRICKNKKHSIASKVCLIYGNKFIRHKQNV
jgi:hypothetical protein